MENQLKVHHVPSYIKFIKPTVFIISFLLFFGFFFYQHLSSVKKADAVVGQLTIPGETTTINVESVQSTSLRLTTVSCGQGDDDGYSILKTVSNVGVVDCDNNVRVDGQGKMTVAGNIGIGTADPGLYKLNVQGGNANFSNTGTFGGLLTITAGGITSAGTITFSDLTASRPVKTGTGGVLSASQISLNSTNDVAGTLPVANGGTGATTLTGMLKGNGTSAVSAVTGTTNYIPKWSGANTISGTSSIYDDGNVGISTTGPNHKFDVRGQVGFYNSGTDGTLQDAVFLGSPSYPTTYRNKIQSSISSVAASSKLIFSLSTGASTYADTLSLIGNNRVGIANTAPGTTLDVGTTTGDIIRSYGGFTGHATANIGGTGAAAYFPNGAWLATGPQWIYGTVTFNGALSGATSFTTSGTVTASGGNSGNWNSAYSHISSNGSSHSFINQNVTTAGTPTFNTVYTSNWFRSTGDSGWYSHNYGGGWYMTDTTWIRAYNNKYVRAAYFYSDALSAYATVGAGTINRLTKWTGTYNQGDSTIYDNGNIGIGTTNPLAELEVKDGADAGSHTVLALTSSASNGVSQISFGDNTSNYLWHLSNRNDLDSDKLVLFKGDGAAVVTFTQTGYVGIGSTSPGRPLEVRGAMTTAHVMKIENTNSAATNDSSGLYIILNNYTNTTHKFATFYSGASPVGRIRYASATSVAYATTGAGDFAEIMETDGPTEAGDILAFRSNSIVGLANPGQGIAGIHSTAPTFVAGEENKDKPYSAPLAVSGIVPLKVNSSQGLIRSGDPIALSSSPGIGAKALKAGYIIGRSLEDYTNSDPNQIGKIKVLVSLSWYDPDALLTDTNHLQLASDGGLWNVEVPATGETITRAAAFSEAMIGRLDTGYLSTSNLKTKDVKVEGEITTSSGASLTSSGTWTDAADASRKTDIAELTYGLAELMQLSPVSFTDITSGSSGIGFIAQEVKRILPEIVYGKEGNYNISYGQLNTLLTKAIQEQQTQVVGLQTIVQNLDLNSSGDIAIVVNKNNTSVKHIQSGSLIKQIAALSELVVGKLKAGIIDTQQILVKGVDIMEKITGLEKQVKAQQQQIDELQKQIKELQDKQSP